MKFSEIANAKGVGLCIGGFGINNQTSDGLDSENDAMTCYECSPRDWKHRARNYAQVCDFLAEQTKQPESPIAQCDKWLIDGRERGIAYKALFHELKTKPESWQGDIATAEGLRSRVTAAYRRAGKVRPMRKRGRPADK